MKNNKGFTLAEILLAVLIVGIIGVALAAVTTAALRESGTGRTRLILRNQLSIAVRQLRQDIQLAQSAEISPNAQTLTLSFDNSSKAGPTTPQDLPDKVAYYFVAGNVNAPGGGKLGGTITRQQGSLQKVWLENVKDLSDGTYPSFRFTNPGDGTDSRIRVQLIVQSNAFPVVNEVLDETFLTPNGVGTVDPCRGTAGAVPAGCL